MADSIAINFELLGYSLIEYFVGRLQAFRALASMTTSSEYVHPLTCKTIVGYYNIVLIYGEEN
jgi:hypothetical protein